MSTNASINDRFPAIARYVNKTSTPIAKYHFEDFTNHVKNLAYTLRLWRLSSPLEVYFELTNRCNLSCVYCYKRSRCDPPQKMTLLDFERVFDELAQLGACLCVLEGGEPILHSQFPAILEALKRRGLGFLLITNGTLLSHEVVEAIKTQYVHGEDTVQVSLDSLSEGNFHNRGIAGLAVFEGLKRLAAVGIHPRVNCVITKNNLNDILSMYCELASQKLIDTFCVNRVMGPKRKDLEPDPEAAMMIFERLLQKSEEMGTPVTGYPVRPQGNCDARPNKRPPYLKCTAMRAKMCISVEGDVYPCVFLEGRIKPLGNVRQNSIAEIWSSTEAESYCGSIPQHCAECPSARKCAQKCAGDVI